MKKLLLAFLALVLAASAAEANWNIRQNDDGSADWVNEDAESYRIARTYLSVLVENISTASTSFVVVPHDGTLVSARSVAYGQVTVDNAVLTVKTCSSCSGNFSAVTTNGTITIAGTGAAGDTDSSGTMSGNATLSAGDSISVATDGGSTGDVDATVIFVIDR